MTIGLRVIRQIDYVSFREVSRIGIQACKFSTCIVVVVRCKVEFKLNSLKCK